MTAASARRAAAGVLRNRDQWRQPRMDEYEYEIEQIKKLGIKDSALRL